MKHTKHNPVQDPPPGKPSKLESAAEATSMILSLVQQASKLTGLPYLSDAAVLALKLVQIAQAVKENKEGFQGLVDDSNQLVAVFYRSYQGAKNQDEWLNSDGIRTAAKDLERCLLSILKLGERMEKRGLFLRILYYAFDASTIKKYRQKLSSATTQFQVAAQLDMRDVLVQIEKNQDELMDEVRHLTEGDALETPIKRAVDSENRARQRIYVEDISMAGMAFGSGDVSVENGPVHAEAGKPGVDPKAEKGKKSTSPRTGDDLLRPDISVVGVHKSGISFGPGNVSVINR